MTMNPFEDPACTCSTAGKLRAALMGEEQPLCAAHDADQLEARRRRELQVEAEAERDRMREVADTWRTPDELAARRERKALEEMDPLERSVRLITARSTDLPLNADPSAYPALAGFHNNGDDAA